MSNPDVQAQVAGVNPAESQVLDGAGGQVPEKPAGDGGGDRPVQAQVADEAWRDLSADQLRQALADTTTAHEREKAEHARTRREAAAYRGQVRQYQDRDKTEEERRAEQVEELTRERDEARKTSVEHERRWLALEVARDKLADINLDPIVWASRLRGETREEIEADADELVRTMAKPRPRAAAYDGGARQTPETKGSAEDEHAKLILNLTGRGG